MQSKINALWDTFISEAEKINDSNSLLALKAKFTGKKGPLSEILSGLKNSSPEERKAIGPMANQLKVRILKEVDQRLESLEVEKINRKLAENKIDITDRKRLYSSYDNHGGLHPLTTVRREIEDIFLSMGFDILDGPHIEDEFHNFEALNIPADHPARDMQDTFWLKNQKSSEEGVNLLRTHTSTIQVRGMMSRKAPFRFIAPGKVFRCERTDASHEMAFHQLEGMMVGEDISVANLIYFMKSLLGEVFARDVEVRLRPGFFPFVEPGFELDIRCLICKGKGCSVCKQVGWVELLPCGMVHPNVLKAGGIDPTVYKGLAFGLGLDRLVMMRYGIDDVRHLQSGDLRFVQQFSEY